MYLLYAPPTKFGTLPKRTTLLSDEVVFTDNIAYCSKFYWTKFHLLIGCIDISPRFMRVRRNKRQINSIVLFATGGIGDSMWAMPFCRHLREKYPNAQIGVVTGPKPAQVWQNVPYANGIIKDEFANVYNTVRNADEVFEFGGIATINKKEMAMDPADACFYHCGYKVPKDKDKMLPWLIVTADEGRRAKTRLEGHGIKLDDHKIVTLSLESSTSNRNWPIQHAIDLTRELCNEGIKVIWTGSSEHLHEYAPTDDATTRNWVNIVCKTNLRELMAIIALTDVFVGSSSGALCIATALKTPSVGLFGAFDPACRDKYYQKFLPIWGRLKCSPCEEHQTECPNGHPAPCMKTILPGIVYDKIKEALTKWDRPAMTKDPIK